MKVTVPTTKEIEVHQVHILVDVMYENEEMPENFPGRSGLYWEAMVEVDTGKIIDWPQDHPACQLRLTVKDSGTYALFDKDLDRVARIQDYVPHGLIPGRYGDTLRFDIDAKGVITNWPRKPDVSAFFQTQN